MYHRTHWLDHVTDQTGAVIQQGTLQDQAHFNNMEEGVADANFAAQILTEGSGGFRNTTMPRFSRKSWARPIR